MVLHAKMKEAISLVSPLLQTDNLRRVFSETGENLEILKGVNFSMDAGYRDYYGSSSREGDYAYFWSSTESSGNAYHMYLLYVNDAARLTSTEHSELYGFSVRCVKD